MKKNNRLTRMVQIMWLIIAAVCAVESAIIFNEPNADKNSAYLFTVVALFAIVRFVMLRRQQLKKENKM
ncbi:MAG: hypothetical protein JXR19_10370 [Bacteroidia bacterium]